MDPGRFDDAARRVSQILSRRSLIGGSLGAAVLAALGLGEEGFAKTKSQRARKSHPGRRGRDHNRDRNHERAQRNDDKGHDSVERGHERRRPGHGKDDKRGGHSNGCVRNGKRCGGKKLRPCKKCCSGYARVSRRKKRTCACRPDGMTCDKPTQCCARICDQHVCGAFFS